jgi:hypothetical protein
VRDGHLDAVAEMPSESAAPVVTTVMLVLVFTLLLTSHYVIAAGFVGATALCAAAWAWHEPEEDG